MGAKKPTWQNKTAIFYFCSTIRFQQRRHCLTSIVMLYADSNVEQYWSPKYCPSHELIAMGNSHFIYEAT